MSQQVSTESTSVSLDSVFNAFKHWRSHKQDYEGVGIPDNIWKTVFQLEQQSYSKAELCHLFGLNSAQYNKKHKQHYRVKEKSNAAQPKPVNATDAVKTASVQFSEALVIDDVPPTIPSLTQSAQQTKQAITRLKSPDNQPERYLDQTTVVVECIRPDGHRLKIHTTSARLDVVMQSFFGQEVVTL